jgi:hypothetical protein
MSQSNHNSVGLGDLTDERIGGGVLQSTHMCPRQPQAEFRSQKQIMMAAVPRQNKIRHRKEIQI